MEKIGHRQINPHLGQLITTTNHARNRLLNIRQRIYSKSEQSHHAFHATKAPRGSAASTKQVAEKIMTLRRPQNLAYKVGFVSRGALSKTQTAKIKTKPLTKVVEESHMTQN